MFEKNVAKYDVVIFSDFNYGCLPQRLVEKIIKVSKKNNITITADSQSSSQLGNISRYHNTKLITPTEREARLISLNNNDGLVIIAEELRKKTKTKNIILKLGSDGFLIHSAIGNNKGWKTDKIPSLNEFPVDTSGAGDSILAITSLALGIKNNIWLASYLGAVAHLYKLVGSMPISNESFKVFYIMQSLILSGIWKRLLHNFNTPKCLIKIKNKPMLGSG